MICYQMLSATNCYQWLGPKRGPAATACADAPGAHTSEDQEGCHRPLAGASMITWLIDHG